MSTPLLGGRALSQKGNDVHELVAAQLGERRLVLRPGSNKALHLPRARFEELRSLPDAAVPPWLAKAARAQWSLNLTDRRVDDVMLWREPGPYQFSRTSAVTTTA